MNEAQLYERIGRTQLTLEQWQENYRQLLQVLGQVVIGEIDTSRVLVNITNQSWVVAEPEQTPPMPATVNGLPICVVAPVKTMVQAAEAESP